MKKLKGQFILFIILEFFWIFWNNSLDLTIWLYGLVIVIPLVFLFSKGTYIFDGIKLTPKSLMYSFLYIGIFIVALIKSNLDVIYRVLHPKLPIRPGIIKIETRLKSPMARMILANSITLTPGTFTVDIKDNILYIHWIEVCCEKDMYKINQKISQKFENILIKIYE
ncbi:MAG TPA: Na+/H+ antiporter subunit E [Bacteroidales bacterium]|nr:Na+/H+ antiporter subunit E [Bacteroidales bacterium]HRX10385.1 Na+/H+ antiporter subunit E [Draconibacterium sp.]